MRFPDTSQGGEGTFLCDFFKGLPSQERILVDVGAYGREISNTWNLMTEGWKGLLIEANPNLIPVIQKGFDGLDYTLLNIAVGTVNTVEKLHIHGRIGSSSLLPDWEPSGKTGQMIDVPVRVFVEVLRENAIPKEFSLLCVDTEGMDKEIIGALLKTEFKPRVIVTEVYSYGTDAEAESFFMNQGYRLLRRFEPGNMWGNMIFAR